jgi:predicted ester cyclase
MAADPARLGRRWFEEVWNLRREETIDELLDPKVSALMEGIEVHGIDDFKKARAELLDAFPDMKVVVEDVVAQGDNVVIRWNATGVHSGVAMALEPTRRPVAFRGMTWLVFQDGRIVKGWDAWNQGALLQSLR